MNSMQKTVLRFVPRNTGKNWLKTESWCIPRRHGNIMSDEFIPYSKNLLIKQFFANIGRTDTIVKDKVYDLNLEKQWHQYRVEAYKKIARQWSGRHKIDLVE